MTGARFEVARKTIHVAMGGFAFALRYLSWPVAALCALAALLGNWLLLPRLGGAGIFRGAGPRRADAGILFYPLSVLALILIFRDRLEIVSAAWAFMAFGDGAATLVGGALRARGGPLPWNREKSWAGLAAFLAAGIPMALLLHGWVQGVRPGAATTVGVIVVGVAAGIIETLPIRLNDNLSVPLAAGGLLYAAALVDPALFSASAALFAGRLPWALGVNLALGVAAFRARTVDRSGLIHGVLLGTVIWVFGGPAAFALLVLFFVLGSAATRIGRRTKEREGTAQERGGRRGGRHAWANTGLAAVFALLAAGTAYGPVFRLGLAAALATALCDTLGSEIGQAYGRRTFLVTTLRPAPRGTDGAISFEGTLAGFVGAALVAGAACALGVVGPLGALAVVIGALAGSLIESCLGAVLERSHMIDNEAQNFLNTLAGALIAIAVARVLG